MLAGYFHKSVPANNPNFDHSSKIDDIFEKALIESIPDFIDGLITFPKTKRLDEEEFSQEFVISLNRNLLHNPKGILAVPEYKDLDTVGANPVKRVDIAFVSSEQGASKIKLYTVEAKRLPTGTGKREKEYIYGHFASGSPAGGIQRFKTEDHAYGLSKSALLGYIEKKEFTYWFTTINSWISDKANELTDWNTNEQLQHLEVSSCGHFSVSRSTANRSSDSINLFHLWIKIPLLSNY
ncbi:hypothetical protein FACS1894182_13870 [Bacteroidia bacterium]|nr:hypothetical protein FACS1894182_13870 [Bacteroidia bacterium]